MAVKNLHGEGMEYVSDEGLFASLKTSAFGSSNWVYERRFKQFKGNLLAVCDEIEQSESSHRDDAVFTSIKSGLKEANGWTEAFALEQSLVQFMSVEAVVADLRRRRAEIDKFFPKLDAHYQYEIKNALIDPLKSQESNRKLLFRLVQDQQWHEVNNYHRHVFVNQLTLRVNILFMFSLAIFFLMVTTAVFGDFKPHYFLMSLISGVFGASFSMIASLENRINSCDLDELRSIRSWASLLTRLFSGAGGGILLYFFIMSNVITITGVEARDLQVKNGYNNAQQTPYALFVLLAFTAGFVEKMIPGLINSTQSRVGGRSADSSESVL